MKSRAINVPMLLNEILANMWQASARGHVEATPERR